MIFTFQCQHVRVLTDCFENKIYQMESSQQVIILPKSKKHTNKNMKQKVKKVKKNVGGGKVEPTLLTSVVREIPKRKISKIYIVRRAKTC